MTPQASDSVRSLREFLTLTIRIPRYRRPKRGTVDPYRSTGSAPTGRCLPESEDMTKPMPVRAVAIRVGDRPKVVHAK